MEFEVCLNQKESNLHVIGGNNGENKLPSPNSLPDCKQDTFSSRMPANPHASIVSLESSTNYTSSKHGTTTSPAPSTSIKEPLTKLIIFPPMKKLVRDVATCCKPATMEIGVQTEDVQPLSTHGQEEAINDFPLDLSLRSAANSTSLNNLSATSSDFLRPIKPVVTSIIKIPAMYVPFRNAAAICNPENVRIGYVTKPRTTDETIFIENALIIDDKDESNSDSEDGANVDSAGLNNLDCSNDQYLTTHAEVVAINYGSGENMLQTGSKQAKRESDKSSKNLLNFTAANTKQNPPPGSIVPQDKAPHVNVRDLQDRQRVGKRMAIMSPLPLGYHSEAKRKLDMNQEPDQNMSFNYTIGVKAWTKWVETKNVSNERNSVKQRPLNTEILLLTVDELNHSLCSFVKEFRKPNGEEYAPEVIYYLVLGIQKYLYENGRVDNIFADSRYELFADCLDELSRRFSNDNLSPVEEKHLWECKQLGPYSPHVLLNYLIFRVTAILKLRTVEEHMALSFSRIIKLMKNAKKKAKVRSRPLAELDGNPRYWKIYEYFEFYLFKCPESVKSRDDIFYLQPKSIWVPSSPIWYSTEALNNEALAKILRRIKMVMEINIALSSR